VRDRGQESERAPEDSTQRNNQLARIAVGKRAGNRRGNHVENQEGAGQISDLRVGETEFILHHGLYGKQDRTVNIVQQIERCEQDQRSARIEFVLGHLGREYNTGKGLNRKARKEYPQRPKNFACSASFLSALCG